MHDDPLLWEPHDRHWIRLRGPWDVAWLDPPLAEESRDEVASGRVTLPTEWRALFGERTGRAQFRRHFQRPTNLDADERVLLTLCDVRCEVTARLNETPLIPLEAPIGDPESRACEDAISYDITHVLQPANRLTLDLTVPEKEKDEGICGLWRPVLLEIITPE